MELRTLIIERVKARGLDGAWLFDVYSHLINQGAAPQDAFDALSDFVDEIIAAKVAKPHLELVK